MYKLNLLEDNISVYNVQTELTAGPYFCIRFMVLYFLDFYSKLFFFYVYNGRLCFTFDANPRNKCVHIPVVWIVNFYKRKRHFNQITLHLRGYINIPLRCRYTHGCQQDLFSLSEYLTPPW